MERTLATGILVAGQSWLADVRLDAESAQHAPGPAEVQATHSFDASKVDQAKKRLPLITDKYATLIRRTGIAHWHTQRFPDDDQKQRLVHENLRHNGPFWRSRTLYITCHRNKPRGPSCTRLDRSPERHGDIRLWAKLLFGPRQPKRNLSCCQRNSYLSNTTDNACRTRDSSRPNSSKR